MLEREEGEFRLSENTASEGQRLPPPRERALNSVPPGMEAVIGAAGVDLWVQMFEKMNTQEDDASRELEETLAGLREKQEQFIAEGKLEEAQLVEQYLERLGDRLEELAEIERMGRNFLGLSS